MYPFWDPVIDPLVRRCDARRIVEIGALRGETTVRMLEDLGPDAELHVIDPLPQFDPAEHEARFPGRYVFHRDLSLNVLPTAPPFDVALVDGDHNWYTVYHELQHLRRAAREAEADLPLLILHDVGWPYGRRDLYYAPWQIPEEFRQPHDQRGMTPGRPKLLKGGGMNITLDNAIEEGGPRNGVRTALDDFMAEHDRPLRQVLLPIYYGLAIVAEEAYLDRHPAVREFLDELESHEGTQRLLELSESIRLEEVVFSHNIERMRNDRLDRAVDRHLSLLRATLVDEHHVDNEVRLGLAVEAAVRRSRIDPEKFRAPRRRDAQHVREIELTRRNGPTADHPTAGHFAFTDAGTLHLDAVHDALDRVRREGTPGDLVDVGCGRGGVGIYLRGYLDAHEIDDRTVWVADEFRSTPDGTAAPIDEDGWGHLWADLNEVRDGFARFGLLDDHVRFVQGVPGETLPDAPVGPVALLHVGRRVGDDTVAVLEAVHDRLSPGAAVVVEAGLPADVVAAVDRFLAARGIDATRTGDTGRVWQRPDGETEPSPELGGGQVPLAPPLGTDTVDLSVLVVFHNMRREAERTLHSLSRAYQRDLGDLTYEVIAVDNGSDPDQRLDEAFVAGFGPEFRLLDLGDDAQPTPIPALNEAMRRSHGENLAFMIDGAHVLTPGVLHHGMTGLRGYAPAVVATQQWYVGPGQQPDVVASGYDQAAEDQLFTNIGWPTNGYRLFEISHFIGDRDWLDGIIESNCLFAPRSLVEQVGAFDEAFSMPGGGYANLELYERLGAHPDVRLVTILGEGSFHQVHGGTTTNDAELDQRRAKTFGYGEHYRELRGRTLGGPAKHLHYVGSFANKAAPRTRSRRLTAMAFDPIDRDDHTGIPTEPGTLADEEKTSIIDKVWHTLAWTDTEWIGTPVKAAPTDLVVYQELLTRVRPDHVIVTGRAGSGVARYAATVCELIGHGTVVALGDDDPGDHPRIVRIEGAPQSPSTVDAVRAVTGSVESARALVVLGSGAGAGGVIAEFEAYAPFVPVGSYVIVENTIVNGHPVWPGYGPGPNEALRRVLPEHGEFVQDTAVERFGLTFNPGGFLRRVT